ncbi:hypothetical protein X798_07651 [Onchocerca flexuosa]|uniref:Uncharacterized protein n=1 Tax=Onchocerca flexuosa TaxID=387005 RepID=A0A238BKF5_9BILA|nr:hypothetical protein X798_07651 [Onchocerca flexuosa]
MFVVKSVRTKLVCGKKVGRLTSWISHEKLIISRDEYGHLLLTVIDQCIGFQMYQMLPCASTPISPNCQKVQQLLEKACQLLEGKEALLPRTYCTTHC